MALGGTDFKMRSRAETIHSFLTAPAAAITAGQMAVINDVVGVYPVALLTADIGDDVAFIYKAEKIIVPCAIATSGSYTEGSKVYYDVADAEVNESASGNYLCGIVLEQPTVGDEEVLIELDGMLSIVS